MRHRETPIRYRIYHLLLIPAVYYAICVSSAVNQQCVIRDIRQSGGNVGISTARTGVFRKMFSRILPDAFGDIDWVKLADVPIKRGWLSAIARSNTLDMLWLQRTRISDLDLKLLAGNVSLRELYLSGNQITDQGLQNLGSLPSLERLELNHTHVQHPALVGDSMPVVWMLKLRGTRVDDLAVAEIGVRMEMIREIDLSKTNVTDEVVEELAEIRTLQSVNLLGSQTSSEGALRLHELLEPNCTVFGADGKCLVARRYR